MGGIYQGRAWVAYVLHIPWIYMGGIGLAYMGGIFHGRHIPRRYIGGIFQGGTWAAYSK